MSEKLITAIAIKGGFVALVWRAETGGDLRSHVIDAKYVRPLAKALTEAADEIEKSVRDDDDRVVTESDGRSADESPSPKSPVWRPVSEARDCVRYLVRRHGEREAAIAFRSAGFWFNTSSPSRLHFNPSYFTPIPEFDGGEVDQ